MPLLGQKNNYLSTLSDVSNADLATYVGKLKRQEGGRNPDRHKINGNMAWYDRAKDNSHPMNQYFDSLGRNGAKVLADLKRKVPEAFGIEPKAAEAEQSENKPAPSPDQSQKNAATTSVPPAQSENSKQVQISNDDQAGLFGMSQTMTYAAVGGGLLLLTIGAIAMSN
jgi:hypothetical protein